MTDSTICYGLAKEGARDHGWARGAITRLAVAAGKMARLRENTARGAAHIGCATPDNSRCGPTAASTPTPSSPPAAGCRFSITIRQSATCAVSSTEQDFPYWMEGAADVAETHVQCDRPPSGLRHLQGFTPESPLPLRCNRRHLLGAAVEVVKPTNCTPSWCFQSDGWWTRSFAWPEKCRRLWKNCERKLNASLQMVVLARFTVLILKRL